MIELPWNITPRRWQEEAYKVTLDRYRQKPNGRYLIQAIMGAGKSIHLAQVARTWAYEGTGKVVITTPTEHLVVQLYEDVVNTGTNRKVGVYYGKKKQADADIIICCNPSVESLCGKIQAAHVGVDLLICDEAHRTEGTLVRKALDTLAPKAILGYSATPFLAQAEGSLTLFDDCIYRYGVAEAMADGNVLVPMRIESSTINGDIDGTCLDMIRGASGPGVCTAADVEDAKYYANYLNNNGVPAAAVYSERMPLTERLNIIKQLETGSLKCIVFVRLLTEGVNLPWLRWLCFRLPITSRVAFAQMAGRVLRAHHGKTEAIYYDPHGLFDFHSLSYAEALGERAEAEGHGTIEYVCDDIARAIREDIERKVHGIASVEALARSLLVACECCLGLTDRQFVQKESRLKRSTPQQQAILEMSFGNARQYIPTEWRPYFDGVLRCPQALRFGPKANLVQVLSAISMKKKFPQIDTSGCIGVPVKKGGFDFDRIGAVK